MKAVCKRIWNLLSSSQITSICICEMFLLLSVSFIDWQQIKNDEVYQNTFDLLCLICIVLPFFVGLIWMALAYFGKCKVEYFKRKCLFEWIASGSILVMVAFNSFFSYCSQSFSPAIKESLCFSSLALGLLIYMILSIFPVRVEEIP